MPYMQFLSNPDTHEITIFKLCCALHLELAGVVKSIGTTVAVSCGSSVQLSQQVLLWESPETPKVHLKV